MDLRIRKIGHCSSGGTAFKIPRESTMGTFVTSFAYFRISQEI